MEVVDSAGSSPLTLSILMERRQGVLPCGEGERRGEGGGVKVGEEGKWGREREGAVRSHLCVIKAVLMGGARQWKGGQSRWRQTPERPALHPPPPFHLTPSPMRGEVGTNSSFSPLLLRGFHQRPSWGWVLRVGGEREGVGDEWEPLLWHHGKP